MTDRAEALIELAAKSFELSQSEQQLLQAVVNGKEANYSAIDESCNDPKAADERGSDRTIRAALLVWLCIDVSASQYITHQGLVINGAKIKESLDLKFANLDFSLIFYQCVFEENIYLEQAKIRLLDLSRYCLNNASSKAEEIQVERDIYLMDRFYVKGHVQLNGATVGGYLNCSGGTFDNPDGDALMNEFQLLMLSTLQKHLLILQNLFGKAELRSQISIGNCF